MSLGGRLDTLDLSAILQTLAVSHASGRLTVTRLDRHAVLLLRSGRLIYAAGGSAGATLAGRLLERGLVSERDLLAALERQHDGTRYRRLGDVLVEMGFLAQGTLRAVVRQHVEELLGELLEWKDGFFRFEPLPAEAEGAVEVDLGDFVVSEGLAPQELLMRAVTALDRGGTPPAAPGSAPAPALSPPSEPATAPAPAPAAEGTGSYTADFTGEVVLSLLRFASQILTRAVVFSVEGDVARGVGEFGVRESGRFEADVVRETVLSLREPSVVRLAVERRRPYVGPLEPTRPNLRLVERLGGSQPQEAVALPLIAAGEVRLVLYGDNGASGRPIGPLDALEAAVSRAARILERTIAARQRQRLESGP
jgi:hypothetical protein